MSSALEAYLNENAEPTDRLIAESTVGRLHFSQTILGEQIAWDSTSLGEFKLCPRSYFYSHVLGLRTKKDAIPLTFGIHYHAALELYDKLRFRGMDHDEAVDGAVEYCLLATRVSVDDPDRKPAEGEPGKSWFPEDPKNSRNTFTLLRAVVWYLDHFKDDPVQTIATADGKPMVELSFRFELTTHRNQEGVPYLLCGHMDRMVRYGDYGIYGMDRKTSTSALGKNYFDGYSPENQMSLYQFAGKVIFNQPMQGMIIDAVQLGTTFNRFQRGFARRTTSQITEWAEELQYWFKLSSFYARERYWPHNDKACSMYGGCKYRGVCSQSPQMRRAHLRQSFEHKPWNPLESR